MKEIGTYTVVEANGRHELRKGDEVIGFSDVILRDNVAMLPHVEVDPAYEGQGLGSRLVREQLADLKSKGLTIRPVCPFVVSYLRRHPDEG